MCHAKKIVRTKPMSTWQKIETHLYLNLHQSESSSLESCAAEMWIGVRSVAADN